MATETTINVNLTPDLYRYVKSVEKSKRYTSVSEFFREALREKKERELARRELELKIEPASGPRGKAGYRMETPLSTN